MNITNRNSPRPGRRTKRRAALMIIAAVSLPSALILVGLVVDVGNICVAKSELQRSSDAAALAATAVLLDKGDLNTTGGYPRRSTAVPRGNPTQVAYNARTAAGLFAGLNPCRSVTLALRTDDVVLTRYQHSDADPNACAFITDPTDPNYLKYNSAKVVARRDSLQNTPIPLYFGGLIGLRAVNATSEAAAFLETDISGFAIPPGSGANCKLLPFSVLITEWDKRVAQGRDAFTHNTVNNTVSTGGDGIYEYNIYPGDLDDCPGNFGTVDIGSSNNSTADLSRQILYGPNAYDFSFFPNNEVKISVVDTDTAAPHYADGSHTKILPLNGDTGISAGIKDELAAIIGQPRILPLHWKASGNGNNAVFRVVKFVGVTIVAVDLTGALKSKYVKVQPCFTVDGTAIGGGDGVTSDYAYKPPRLRMIKDGK